MRERIDGRYELTQQISSGGMGSVWRGFDSVLDRPVAIKRIRLDMVDTGEVAAEFTERFRREARVTAKIRHHGVPQVYDAVLDASFDSVYLVMEYIDGHPLRDYIEPGAQLPLSWVASVAAQIATVLSHAHALPVVHRDLKPDNVLLTADGSVKVIDFGIAALLDGSAAGLTRTGQQIGTPRYMAPERIHGHQVTPRADLYALGCIIHEMIAGIPLFAGDSPYLVQHAHMEEPPAPLRQLRTDVPAEFEQLVLDLLEKQPARRPADAYTVYERLLPFLPAPGSDLAPGEHYLPGLPDPTRIFRRPNAPLETSQVEPTRVHVPAVVAEPTAPLTDHHLAEAIDGARRQYEELLDQARFAQAAEALAAVLDNAAEARGPDNADVLGMRRDIAAAWALSGDYRRAHAELRALAEAYRRVEGRYSESAWEVRAFAARCQMQLGEIDEGLDALRALLDEVVTYDGDSCPLALELRRDLGELLLGVGDLDGAAELLETLAADLEVLRLPDDPLALEVADQLAQLRELRDGRP
ncbi:serine/threonine-protein kinase [Nocardia farcinica]|uniref:serine/threonine-protein kinase n=1 Tax=Nocardia farcinica TaxID=37329 RepID=UPI0024588044|nr:serine/threonine-protein kinase [Nocardia farcinica]